jgi:hypothetical protein
MSQIIYSDACPTLFNVPNQPITEANARMFHALTAFDENIGYKIAKAMRAPPPQKTRPAPAPRAPLATSENIDPRSAERTRSYGELKRVKTITKNVGKTIMQRRRKEKENLAIKFFHNGF